MYAFIFRHLPGPTALKVIEALLLLALVFYVLMEYVFPWVSTIMPYADVAVS
ncbi:hypothetical protein H0194_05110 [Corynebacterium incognita]|uniref:Uncharacterized protein n=1 Tax=Corynebacterium incognita TaxID=2754725 RepID=A0A7G7CRY5_9CORY|nr:hypothetical protein [Corynebacterium incognita]QNE90351.1 hypothetical protein H0194_05110 [Corynebacterium incognita]